MDISEHKNIPHKDCVKICNDFHGTIEFIGKKWMGVIIYALLDGPKRFHELQTLIPNISDRLLTERLKDLEKEGLIIKKIINAPQKRVEYELTSSGKELEDVIKAIKNWIDLKVNK